jgi:Ca-activated chloride channel family protein
VLAERPIRAVPLPATITAPATAVAGSTIAVTWDGPGGDDDMITAAIVSQDRNVTRVYTRDGNPAQLRVPSQARDYELRYIDGTGRVLATAPLTVTPASATIEAPDSAPMGSTISVAWTGLAYEPDQIVIARPGETRVLNRIYMRDGTPQDMLLPPVAGLYELRYLMQDDEEVIATRSINVTPVVGTLLAPATAVAGSTIRVDWTGPDYANDFIGVGRVDEPDRYENYAYTRDGNPASLVMPAEPGAYEIRYFMNQERTVIARHAITVSDVVATLEAPASAEAGSTVRVHWTGPDYANDFIGVGRLDEPDRYENYAYTRDGSPAALLMPAEPGEYEIRYFVNQDRTVIARHPITVGDVVATLEAPDSAPAGSTVSVTWTGPDYQNDFIGVGRMDQPDRYENYAYTRDGSPARVEMPTTPGTYELRYFVNQDRTVIARRVIEVTALSVTLSAPPSASVGETVSVTWEGPDYRNDFIAASRPDDDGYETYSYTRDGNPARLQMPSEPGSYEIRYFVNQDRTVVARIPVTVADIVATLSADPSGVAGGSVMVAFEGPNYRNDYIAISRADDPDGYETYGYTRDGNPVRVTLPDAPGAYEIRYVMNQDRRILGRIPFTVTAP